MVSLRFAYVGSGLLALVFIFYTCYTWVPHFNVFEKNVVTTGIKNGIYSGTFDPPTKAHNAIIRNSITRLGLTKLYIFVNKNDAKNCKCTLDERIAMLRLMLADVRDKVVFVPQLSDNKHNEFLKIKQMAGGKCVLITGEDSYKKRLMLPPSRRTEMDAICIVPRDGKTSINQLEANAFFLPLDMDKEVASLSSTQARQKLVNKNYANVGLIPDVLTYILNNSLYGGERKKEVSYHV